MSLITIKSKPERLRRAGIEFTRAGVEIETAELTPTQALALVSEPMLIFLVDGVVMDRPSAERLADMQEAIAQDAAEKAEAEKAAAKAEAEKAAAEEAAATNAETEQAAPGKDKKADKKAAK